MILLHTKTGHGVAAIPSSGNWSFGEWHQNQNVEIILDKNDPRWSDEGDNIIINGVRCRLEDLTVVDKTVSDLDLAMMFREAVKFYEPQSYYELNHMAAYGSGSPDSYADDMCDSVCFRGVFDLEPSLRGKLFNQFLVLLDVANEPFSSLLAKMRLTPLECANRFAIDDETMQDWVSGHDSPPPYVRLMMAEATGLLKLRNLT